MSSLNGILIYLLITRSTIVAAGIVSMLLGYKLFCKGVGLASTNRQGSAIESSIAGAKFSLKNAAPGTIFVVFGAILVSVMLIQSSPSVTMEMITKWQDNLQQRQAMETTEKLTIRGEDQDSILALTLMAKEYERRGDRPDAERVYLKAVTEMAEPINDLAWLYLQSGRRKDAIGLARVAVQLRPDEPRYVDTLNRASAAER